MVEASWVDREFAETSNLLIDEIEEAMSIHWEPWLKKKLRKGADVEEHFSDYMLSICQSGKGPNRSSELYDYHGYTCRSR